MLEGKKITVVMPAYNAERTLRRTVTEMPDIVDSIIVVDDCSSDGTKEIAKSMKVKYIRHDKNLGYGGNQKTCFQAALATEGNIIVIIHPDYQYSPRLLTAICAMIISGHYDVILASRILGDQSSRKKSMPLWRYFANRVLTLTENIILWRKFSEYHTGYRAYTSEVIKTLPLSKNSDGFVFDNEILIQALYFGFRIGEVSCPTSYHAQSSSISFTESVKYGVGVIRTALIYRLQKWGLIRASLFRHSS